jgi:hypothetical protein
VPTEVDVQLAVAGLYRPPVLTYALPVYPPHTIIVVPVQTVPCPERAAGTFAPVAVADHEAVAGS